MESARDLVFFMPFFAGDALPMTQGSEVIGAGRYVALLRAPHVGALLTREKRIPDAKGKSQCNYCYIRRVQIPVGRLAIQSDLT